MDNEIALTKNNEFQNVVLMIKQAQIRAYSAVNHELIDLYFSLGKYISVKVEQSNWGKGVVKELADYIAKTAPELTGFSDKNLWRMKQFYETYKDDEKLSPLVRELSWTNNLIIFSRTKSAEERAFYLKKSLQEKYTKRELERQIDSNLYESTVHNGLIVTPAVQELVPNAQEIFRDTYTLEFLGLPPKHDEKDLRKALVRNMKQFILELGKDFIFIDEEYRVQVGNSDFFIDLLFYHRELQCLVAFELKTGKFEPEHLGQLNFYLEALDRDVKKEKENPSIGILLCRDKDDDVVEYALSRSLSPAMVAEYKLHLPDKKVLQQRIKALLENTEV
ncbi:PDDEXK nuclease domain-containing protein [Treponema sp.]|uniref:PDDEXK nuclease domain-containing protein n=1 Tax=Treponema sp. TaxID=166 RepID=UPI00298E310B|nr:PDDEXK nuclease domain-containing protein [Treponema sp.]